MMNFLLRIFRPTEYLKCGAELGVPRSPEWPSVRDAHLKIQPLCQVCGGTSKLNVHHILPFHLDQSKELDPTNLITLCESGKPLNCHLIIGHADNFATKWNPNVISDSKLWNKRLTAKTETDAF